MSDQLVFLDTETTGLDPERHEMWELAYIVDGKEVVRQLPVDLRKADSGGLRISRYYERFRWTTTDSDPSIVVGEFARVSAGRHLVGAVPSFDAAFLERLLRRFGLAPAWHYHLVDVEALAAGKLGLPPPWDSEELSRAVGVEPPSVDERHTALGDARWAKRVYEAVCGEPAFPEREEAK